MTDEVKVNVDDMKDFAHQAGLEIKMRARNAKLDADNKMHAATGHPSTGSEQAKATAAVKLANARDFSTQVGLEAKKKSRDTKLSMEHSAAGRAVIDAADATGEAATNAKESVMDAVLPVTKTVESTSTRGVDITHIENARNDRLLEQQRAQRAREAAQADKEKEIKRQQLLDDTKATVNEKTETIGAVLADARDQVEVALGKAAVAAKNKLDELTEEAEGAPTAKVTPRTSDRGIDISAVSNPRNESMLERDARMQQLAKAKEPTLADKAAAALSNAGDSIKNAYVEATTDTPTPVYVAKQSSSGIDISSMQNPANPQLAAAEEKKLKEQRARELAREKEVLKDQVVQPVKDDLGSKLDDLGSSIAAAANKLGASIQEAYTDLVNPAPLDIHAKKSDNGIDTTSIQNADNNAIGEQIKDKNKMMGLGAITAPSKAEAVKHTTGTATAPRPAPTIASSASSSSSAPTSAPITAPVSSAPSSSAASASSGSFAPLGGRGPPPHVDSDLETRVIKGALDSGVAAREAKDSAAAHTRVAAAEARAAGHEVKEDAKGAMDSIKSELSSVGDKVAEKVAQIAIAPTAL